MPIRLTRFVKILLVFLFVSFLIQQTGDRFFGAHFFSIFSLSSSSWERHQFWQLFTYVFVHRDVSHLLFNSLMVAFVGSDLESFWGFKRFFRYTFFCAISVALVFVFFGSFSPGYHQMAGASGLVYGLLTAYGLIFKERVLLFMMFFPMKARHFVWVLAIAELLSTLYASGGVLSGVAQLAAMGFGFVYLQFALFDFSTPRSKKKRRSQHLALVVDHDQRRVTEKNSGSLRDSDQPRTWH
jgi:membrane associated rhomboid family serine protease